MNYMIEYQDYDITYPNKSYNINEIPEDEKGEVKAAFQKWPAISKNNKSFSVGEKVLIVEISGNKLVVEELQEIEIN